MNRKIKIMLVEDHPKYRKVIKMALEEESDMELTGTFGAAEIALRSVQDMRKRTVPDIVLLDLNLPGMSGHEALPWFKKYIPNTQIMILTQFNSEADVLSAIQAGASGYLLKSSTVTQIKEGIRTVVDGGSSLDGKVAKFILSTLKKTAPQRKVEKLLSQRELEILTCLAEGLVKKEISDRLNIGYGSVATYIRRIYEKLNVQNAPAAVAEAYKTGLFNSNP
jgi:DNA-binding NarL/FixJ family response regulator